MMANHQVEWIYNLLLRLAVVVFLGTLALGLILGVAPLTASLRSGVAFITFAILAWAAAHLWKVPTPEETPADTEDAERSQETPGYSRVEARAGQEGVS
jgi:hypothetical protein